MTRAVILSGGPASAHEAESPSAPQKIFELGVPVLGICYGMQTMAQQLGGKVEAGKLREFGYAEVRARGHTKLLEGIARLRGAAEKISVCATTSAPSAASDTRSARSSLDAVPV